MSIRKYVMEIAPPVLKHLGLRMYSGATPAIAELISNAYDAMAKNVWIHIPLGERLDPVKHKIVVQDDGHGMTYEECNDLYLKVGTNRRERHRGGSVTERYKDVEPRRVHGRKGIGKLAGFGVASRIEVRSIKDGKIAHFGLDYDELKRGLGHGPRALGDDGKTTDKEPETSIILSNLTLKNAVPEAQFKRNIARRLLVLGADFNIHVNGDQISLEEMQFQFRRPQVGWKEETLSNGHKIRWWAGFHKDPIPEEDRRGFIVYVRGKAAQSPWLFGLKGNIWGQHGLQHLAGAVQADFLDEEEDLITTDRGSVQWDNPVAASLQEWGQGKIKSLVREWVDVRRVEKKRSPKIVALLNRAKNFPKQDQELLEKFVDKVCSIPTLGKDEQGKDLADELVELAFNAISNQRLMRLIRQLNAAKHGDFEEFLKILDDWDIINAVFTAQQARVRIEVIRGFKKMIKVDEEEEKMQDLLKKHVWLMDPSWTMLAQNKSLNTLFGEGDAGEAGSGKRPDFFCLGRGDDPLHVIEVKRPSVTAGEAEVGQIWEYVNVARNKHNNRNITGLLIAGDFDATVKEKIRQGKDAGVFEARTWDDLLAAAETLHQEFLDAAEALLPPEAGDGGASDSNAE